MKQSEEYREERKNGRERKYLDMIVEGKLKDPPPSIIKKISAELGLEIHSG